MQNPNPYAGGPQGMARRAGMPGQPGYPGGLNVGPNLANRANVPSPIVVSPFGGQQLPLNEMQAQLAARRSGVQMGPNGMPLSPGGNGMMPGSAGGALPGVSRVILLQTASEPQVCILVPMIFIMS